MTIKEIEERSGLTRANIRYYETEGLLNPARGENGYRDYSEGDLEELLRIKLLRSLDLSLEDIRKLKEGKGSLADAMKSRLQRLSLEKKHLESRENVCRSILKDNPSYSSMDTEKYLGELKRGPEPVNPFKSDIKPRVTSPWKRLFARYFDLTLYSVICDLILIYIFLVSPLKLANSAYMVLSRFLSLLAMFWIEPLLLSTWGTTPGKWIFGLSVRDKEGFKLTFGEATTRIQRVLLHGMGLTAPVYSLVRLWKSYQACFEDDLEWERSTVLELKDERKWRNFAYIGANVLLCLVFLFGCIMSSAPKHRGELTKIELIENYNRYVNYYDFYTKLDEEGRWDNGPEPGVVTINLGPETPDFVYTEEDGVITGVSLSYSSGDTELWEPAFQEVTACMVYSLARSGDGYSPLFDKTEDLTKFMSLHPYEDFSFELYGYSITGDYEYEGYIKDISTAMLWPVENEEQRYSYELSIKKIH